MAAFFEFRFDALRVNAQIPCIFGNDVQPINVLAADASDFNRLIQRDPAMRQAAERHQHAAEQAVIAPPQVFFAPFARRRPGFKLIWRNQVNHLVADPRNDPLRIGAIGLQQIGGRLFRQDFPAQPLFQFLPTF